MLDLHLQEHYRPAAEVEAGMARAAAVVSRAVPLPVACS